MALENPTGSGMSLEEFLGLLCDAVNRSYDLTSDESILVTQHATGRTISSPQMPGPFFALITGWSDIGTSGKRWRYSWKEVDIGGEYDDDFVVTDGNHGGQEGDGPTTHIINLAEINNTEGPATRQGNGMELVAPIGGGVATAPEHKTIVPVWISTRTDGSNLYWTNVSNSDHITESSFQAIGTSPAADESHTETPDTTSYELDDEDIQDGKYDNGRGLNWHVDQRTNYTHTAGSPVLRGFYRQLIIRPNGKIQSVLRENLCTIDTPEECDDEE